MKYNTEKEAGSAVLKQYGDFFKQQYLDYCCLSENEFWESNKSYLPLQITIEPQELVPVIDLVSSDNTLMTKVLGALTSLCIEINRLKQEAFSEHFIFLSTYEEYKSSISSQMKSICQLSAFTNRCDEVLRNICSQVFALYTEGVVKLNGIQLHYIINHIGELFTIIVLLDMLIQNCSLITNWNKYLNELKLISQVPNKEGISEERLNTIQIAMENITIKIMSDNIVQNSLQGLSVLRQKLVDKNASPLQSEMEHYMKAALSNLDKLINEKPTSLNMYKCIKINVLFLLNSNLLGTNDKKIFKSLMELNAKAHSVPIMGTTMWYPEQFLQRFLPSICGSQTKLAQNMLRSRQTFLANKKTSLSKDVMNLQVVSSQLILNIEEYFSSKNSQLSASEMNLHAKTLLATIEIASQTQYSLLTFINLHLSLGVPLSKTILMAVFNIIEILKGIKNSVNRNRSSIINSINMVKQHLMFQATLTVTEIKKNLMTDKNYANQRLDELTCIVIAEKALMGVANTERILAANVALSFVPETTYTEDNYSRLGMLLEKVLMLKTFPEHIENFCDCSWLLWHQNIIPMYLDQNFAVKIDAVKLKFFLSVLEDCTKLFHSTDAKYDMEKSKEFLLRVKSLLEETVLKSMSHQIETNLRLHIHSHLQLDVPNPFTVEMTKKTLLTIENLRLVQFYMTAVPHVEHYLSTMYYNLTTVVLSDWKTYGEMRQMAKFKFNLKTVEDNLPTQTLEQGLDVLEIMRNINIFVSKYLYNLNNQIFIEKSSNNKHLNSINIKHVANSIRTHGTGIMNTTVNFTYQFLKKKFFTFSQFLYDEHIKSRLIKDLKIFKETAAVSGNMYNFKSAKKFNNAIRSLGLSEDGQTYLDLFRDLISQIGNAMGYVRMVRSGGRHCCADATVFLPTYEITYKFKDICEENSLSSSTIESAECLDNNIGNLICNFMQGTEYFKLLVDVFAPTFRNPKNIHLNYFFVIIPPLTLNFVEYMTLAKDKMTKKNKAGAAFTDDGFAMGVAYILKLLDQDKNFESLHWFDSVWKHIREERQLLEEQKSKGPFQLQQALALTEKKLTIFEQEFQLLYYSLTSARIFFR